MRVLHIHSGNMYGGVETLLATLARLRDLAPMMEPHFALCFDGRLSEELTTAGVPVHLLGNVRISRPLSVVRARKALRDLLGRIPFDSVICHSAWSQSLFGPAVRAAKVPLVFWLHSETNGQHWLERWARKTLPDMALSNSEFTAKTLPNMYPQVRSEVIYCPVAPPDRDESSAGRPGRATRAARRAQLQTPENGSVIIQVSRMEAWKGHALHLEALSRLKDLPGWVCWQVGGAQRPGELVYFENLKKLAADLGIADRVHFLGQRSDVPRLLAAADIHCQPNSGPEPFGIAFIEALHAGLPVVTTAIGGACEIVDESCGLLVPPGESRALAASLRRLIENEDLRSSLGANGPRRAQELCDPATQIERLGRLLASVARRPTASSIVQQEVTG
jgi:glycosyltransferase involved in cell wall biosynthesis